MSNLADVKSKEVKVNLGGKERTLKYNLGAYAELEEMGYEDFLTLINKIDKMSMKALRDILYVGLKQEDKELKIEEVNEFDGDFEQIKIISEQVTSALLGTLPQEDGQQTKN